MDIVIPDGLVAGRPRFLAFELPMALQRGVFQNKWIGGWKRALQPMLAIVGDDGIVVLPNDTLKWSANLLGVPDRQISRKLKSVGRPSEFTQRTIGVRIPQRAALRELLVQPYGDIVDKLGLLGFRQENADERTVQDCLPELSDCVLDRPNGDGL